MNMRAALKDAHRERRSRSRAGNAAASRSLTVAMVVEAAGGGVAVHLADLIPGLAARGVDVHLIATQDTDRFDAQCIKPEHLSLCRSVTRVPMRRNVGLHDLASFMHVARALARIRPDIVHAHSSKAGVLARACPGPWSKVYTPHAVYTLNPTLKPSARCVYGAIEKLFGRWLTHRLIAVSDDEARHLRDVLKIPGERIATVWNGVPEFETLDRKEARRRLGLADDAFVVGLVGRFAFQKGVDRLVAIAREVGQHLKEEVQFVCIGSGDFAATAGAHAHSLPENIRVIGAVPQARRLFEAFDALALPSRYEGFPYVYLEAVAAGVPIVSTRVAGADALVTAHETGVVVPNGDDPGPFADALIDLATDTPRLARLRANCLSAAAHFTADRMVDETLAVYRQCINRKTV
ncbi:glycosyl transferase, group 1 [Caballeronia concitans]|uniref:Glycosyl transferase, group 1 n=2 Tax=Caballeronia concitans TaxID=1777133 RepID=A0A658QQ37_9BURK|nr:glycosyl transferase group 1 [Burkholderia sp. MR1]SAL09144.1 glycosyl transferase, group 1 [Caballeronia concitans]